MYCTGCGLALAPGQPVCPQCGRPAPIAAPPVPGMPYLVSTYASKIKTLGVFWIIYAALNLLLGLAGMAFLHAWMNHWGWSHGPWSGEFPLGSWFGPALVHLALLAAILRSVLAFAAGWGLIERTQWGRFAALVAAFLSLIKFPFGTALAIFTLVLLLGYRNNALYTQLQQTPTVL
jgi:hypothetical protein